MTMSRYWVRDTVTDALVRNPSCHGVPARYSKMDPNVSKAVIFEYPGIYTRASGSED